MFLSWISKCELVPLTSDSHVLKKFSEKCQRTLCSMVVTFLNTEGVDVSEILPSGHHIRWSMEIIGHSFALGMEDADVIAGAIRLYERWLGVDANAKVKDGRPACMQKVEQAFIQDLLGQMTLLFEERQDAARATTDVLMNKQVQLCSRVLEIFEAVAKRRGNMLSPQTWDRMIRLLVGAADGILHGSRSVLGNHLCGALVRILFELYLRSLTYCGPRGETWNLLQKFYRRWIHRHLVIEQWNSVTLALTRTMMKHLQTLDTNNDLEIMWAENRLQSKMEIETSLVAYAWYRLLRVVGHPTGFADPDVYLVALKGISRLADEFTRIEQIPVVQWDQVLGALNSTLANRETVEIRSHGDENGILQGYNGVNGSAHTKRPRSPPDVNTVLRLLGPWLFDACLTRSPRYAACRSEALRCLGKLISGFSSGRSKRIHWAYAMRSLMSLQTALLEDDDRIVASAVFNWSRVFGSYGNHTLRGSSVISGSFHRGIDKIFRTAERLTPEDQTIGGFPIILLRRSCIEACCSLLTLHTHLPRSLVKEAETDTVDPAMVGMSGLFSTLPKATSSQVVALLVNAFKTETDPTNQQMMLWLLTVAIQQEATFWSAGLASSRNSQVPLTILLMCSVVTKAARYKSPVMFTALECLRHLSLVSDELYQHATSSVVHLVNACCDFIIASKPVLRSNRAPFFLDELMGAAYRCITEWVASSPLLLSKPPVVSKIISTVIDTGDRSASTISRMSTVPVRDASQKLLNMLMKQHAAQWDTDTSGLNEKAILAELCERDPSSAHLHCRFFSVNKTAVMSVIEKPATEVSPSPETVMIVRDATGRYVWRTKPRFQDGPRHTSLEEYTGYLERAPRQSDTESEDPVFTQGDDEADFALPEAGKDPLLHALRATSLSSNLMSWHIQNPASAGMNGSDIMRQPQLLVGEGNSGLSSLSERKANAMGREAKDIQDSVFTELLAHQSRADEEATANLRIAYKKCSSPSPPSNDQALSSWEVSRRMMTELGFLSVRNWGTLFSMNSGTGDLLNELESLDRLPTKDTFEFGVAYVTSQSSEGGFDNVHVISSADVEVGITNVSAEYERFVLGLGDRVDLAENAIHHSAASARFAGDAICHSSYEGDSCFYVATYPLTYRYQNRFLEPGIILERSSVLIVWNETQLNYRPGTVLWDTTFRLPTPSSQVVIIINPLGNNLFCVRIAHEGSPLFNLRDGITREDENYVDEGEVHCARVLGPLQDGMVVNGMWLAPLVRQTAINAASISRAYHRYQHAIGSTTLVPPEGPEWTRERMLTSIVEKYMRPQLPGEFYGGLFSDVARFASSEDDMDDDFEGSMGSDYSHFPQAE